MKLLLPPHFEPPTESDGVARSGVATVVVSGCDLDLVRWSADEWAIRDGSLYLKHHNAYVRSGLRNSLLREFGLGGTAVGFIGVSSNTTAVTLTTRFLNGGSAGAAANTKFKAISPAATITADTDGTAQTVTGGATFTSADFGTVFVFNKLGFGLSSTLPETDGNLIDVIGGTGGTSPYNRTFALDLTGAGSGWTAVLQIAVTASAT